MTSASDTVEREGTPPIDASGDRLTLLVISDRLIMTRPLPATGEVTIGRAPACDIAIDDPSMSRTHAMLSMGPPLRLRDLGSSNGTRVGDRVVAHGHDVEIAPGDVIRIGGATLIAQTRVAPERTLRLGEVRAVGASIVAGPRMQELYRLAERIAAGTITVLILGETGVGKEVFAERLHHMSPRAAKPYLKLNCAALSETLLESELFGHERGAFTGATQAKPGLLETAEGGTVFLDEIGELPPSIQVKLLRVLEERVVTRVGGLRPRPLDVRFVAATNRDLEAEVARGVFRQDLFFRLNGATLLIPPLRERESEIPDLARVFADQAARNLRHAEAPAIAPEALALLQDYSWPGNIRELRNAIERGVLVCGTGPIGPTHLPLEKMRATIGLAPARDVTAPIRIHSPQDADERETIMRALAECRGNQTAAARMLGVSRRTLVNKLERHHISGPRKLR